MRQIQSTDAKTHFARLLRDVEGGEEFAITKHGRVVAHLMPAQKLQQSKRIEAIQSFLNARKQWRSGDMTIDEILEARHAGHRY